MLLNSDMRLQVPVLLKLLLTSYLAFEASGCSMVELQATEHAQVLFSPNFPSYNNGLLCYYKINPRRGYRVVLEVLMFNTEECCDFLQISDEKSSFKWSGVVEEGTRFFSNSSGPLRLQFTTNSVVGGQGFVLTYYSTTIAVRTMSCSSTIFATRHQQLLISPNFPSYRSHLNCIENMSGSDGKRVTIKTETLHTEECCDKLYLTSGQRKATWSGHFPTRSFHSDNSNQVRLHFSTNSDNTYNGFVLSYNATLPPLENVKDSDSSSKLLSALWIQMLLMTVHIV